MRYRPFAHTGMAISALSLSLDGNDTRSSGDWCDLIRAAFEARINAFEIKSPIGRSAAGRLRRCIFGGGAPAAGSASGCPRPMTRRASASEWMR